MIEKAEFLSKHELTGYSDKAKNLFYKVLVEPWKVENMFENYKKSLIFNEYDSRGRISERAILDNFARASYEEWKYDGKDELVTIKSEYVSPYWDFKTFEIRQFSNADLSALIFKQKLSLTKKSDGSFDGYVVRPMDPNNKQYLLGKLEYYQKNAFLIPGSEIMVWRKDRINLDSVDIDICRNKCEGVIDLSELKIDFSDLPYYRNNPLKSKNSFGVIVLGNSKKEKTYFPAMINPEIVFSKIIAL